jgi:hypothetical protein
MPVSDASLRADTGGGKEPENCSLFFLLEHELIIN